MATKEKEKTDAANELRDPKSSKQVKATAAKTLGSNRAKRKPLL